MKLQILIGKNKGFFGKKSMKRWDIISILSKVELTNGNLTCLQYLPTPISSLNNPTLPEKVGKKNNLFLEVEYSVNSKVLEYFKERLNKEKYFILDIKDFTKIK